MNVYKHCDNVPAGCDIYADDNGQIYTPIIRTDNIHLYRVDCTHVKPTLVVYKVYAVCNIKSGMMPKNGICKNFGIAYEEYEKLELKYGSSITYKNLPGYMKSDIADINNDTMVDEMLRERAIKGAG